MHFVIKLTKSDASQKESVIPFSDFHVRLICAKNGFCYHAIFRMETANERTLATTCSTSPARPPSVYQEHSKSEHTPSSASSLIICVVTLVFGSFFRPLASLAVRLSLVIFFLLVVHEKRWYWIALDVDWGY